MNYFEELDKLMEKQGFERWTAPWYKGHRYQREGTGIVAAHSVEFKRSHECIVVEAQVQFHHFGNVITTLNMVYTDDFLAHALAYAYVSSDIEESLNSSSQSILAAYGKLITQASDNQLRVIRKYGPANDRNQA